MDSGGRTDLSKPIKVEAEDKQEPTVVLVVRTICSMICVLAFFATILILTGAIKLQ